MHVNGRCKGGLCVWAIHSWEKPSGQHALTAPLWEPNFPRLRWGLRSGHHVRTPPHTPAALNSINLSTETIKVSFRWWLYLTHTSWLINWDYITGRRPHFTRRQTTRQMIYDIYSTTCCIIQAVSLMSSFTKNLSWAKNICESISILVSNPAFFLGCSRYLLNVAQTRHRFGS